MQPSSHPARALRAPIPLLPLLGAALALSTGCAVQGDTPEETDGIREALTGGKTTLRARYRFEEVDDDAFSKEAHASTLRTTLGYETGRYENLRGKLAFENVTSIGNDLFNSPTNGVSDRPVVADPEGTEIEEAWIAWDGAEDIEVKVGRQVIKLGNLRFVGDVGWRQNHQVYDAVRFDWTAPSETKVFAAYVNNVNRIFGDASSVGDASSDTILVQADHSFRPEANLSAYGFLLDSSDFPGTSTSTFGARLTGTIEAGEDLDALYAAEFAVQTDRADNPNEVDQEYLLAELGARIPQATAMIGLETLGGSGDPNDAFQTPLATLHKFNGWADRFLVTPDQGLVDLYLSVNGKVEDVAWKVAWHDFSSDSDSLDYGTELDASVSRPLNDWIEIGLKAALYDADDFSTDVTKAWAWISFAP